MAITFLDMLNQINEMDDTEKAIFQAGAHGAGRQTKKGAALPPDHPRSLMDIGPSLKDRGFSSSYEAPEKVKLNIDAATYYDKKGDSISKIIDNLIRQDDNLFRPGDKIGEDDLIEKLRGLTTKPDAGGYRGGEDIKLIDDEKVKSALNRMTAADPAYKILAFQPTIRGKNYTILKSKRDIRPEEEATTSARYANPAGKQKELTSGGIHPVVKQGELDIQNKINIFKRERDNAMQNGYGNSLKQAGAELFKALNALEQNPFVQEDRKAQYKILKSKIRNMIDTFAKQHGEESLQKMKPMMASPTPPVGNPMKAPHSANQPSPFALAHEWAEISGLDLND